jgi:cellulose synthase/poly-beta-1,6-N-acetylglucosamine synthase-like glycosyltransferase
MDTLETRDFPSARQVVSRSGMFGFVSFLVACGLACVIWLGESSTLALVYTAIAVLYFQVIFHKLICLVAGALGFGRVRVDRALAQETATRPALLPVISYLVTLRDEDNREIMGRLVAALKALNYPRERLQVVFVLANSDTLTTPVLHECGLDSSFMTIWRAPRPDGKGMKPKDLVAAMRAPNLVRGAIVCVLDAEDEPDADQPAAVVAAFNANPHLKALQCELRFRNARKNLSTHVAATAYFAHFNYLLPGYCALDSAVDGGGNLLIPLGGTSNYFQRDALEAAGLWDAHNITEDLDLGVRFARTGVKVGYLDGYPTMEEPNAQPLTTAVAVQWTRWVAGHGITLLVHLRDGWRLLDELGPLGFLHFLYIGLTPFLGALIWVQLLLTALYWLGPAPVSAGLAAAMAPALVLSWFNFLTGNLVFIVLFLRSALRRGLNLLQAFAAIGGMWLLFAVVGVKAQKRIFVASDEWHKTKR